MSVGATERILPEADCVRVAEQIFGFQRGGGETLVRLVSYWGGDLRWGRNRVTLASDRRETVVEIWRRLNRSFAGVTTNQLDAAGLEAAMRKAEYLMRLYPFGGGSNIAAAPYLFKPEYPAPTIWSEATYRLTPEERGQVARALIEPAEAKGMLSAGYLAAEAQAHAVMTTKGHRLYARLSQAQCAMTVRDPEGTGSGWAGKTSYDWAKIDGPALAQRALQKCLASRNPATLEPGRYTVILEPQAVADLLVWLVNGDGINSLALGRKVADERVTIGQDPLDPELGARPFDGEFNTDRPEKEEPGEPYRAATWIKNGVATEWVRSRWVAVARLNENLGLLAFNAFRMQGGPTSPEEMIATTKRGLLVTRFWGVRLLGGPGLRLTGYTRDGLWLIENGKIMKPVKNFRFVDSPLFVLNQLEQLGPAELVFRPGPRGDLLPAVVPPLKARDFNFTALVDAV